MADNPKGIVYFVGAGPGDPDLITIKGQKLLASADLILYAGSLVAKKMLAHAPSHAECYSSAGMNLTSQVSLMSEAIREGKQVVRLHTGDPSLYGAIAEQMQVLDKLGIPYRVVPGVSSAFAAAAALSIELTLPEATQTVILTRISGRTPVPEQESLTKLATHQSSLVIFLSTGMIERVVNELLAAGYSPDTPIAVAYRVSWPDEIILKGTLQTIAPKVLEAEITHHALIVVSPSLATKDQAETAVSHLYSTAHDRPERENTIAIITLTRNGTQTGLRLLKELPESRLYAPERFLGDIGDRIVPTITSIRQTLQSAFQRHRALVCIMASGIVVREVAPLLKSKHVDPAVVNLDEAGKFTVSLLSGHKGGANQLAQEVARILGGQAVISTASDTQGLPALDLLAQKHGWTLESSSHLTEISAALVNDDPIGLYQNCGTYDWLPDPMPTTMQRFSSLQEMWYSDLKFVVCVTYRDLASRLTEVGKKSLVFHPQCLHVGVGCNRGTPMEEIYQAICDTFESQNLSMHSIAALATIQQKADEAGLLQICEQKDWPLKFFSSEELSEVPNLPNPSEYAQKCVGAPGVAEPAALLSAGANRLLVEKRKFSNVTVAVAIQEINS